MINRLKILLDQPEYSALLRLAERELRNPADQVRQLVRQELIRQGFLPNNTTPSNPQEKMQFYEPVR